MAIQPDTLTMIQQFDVATTAVAARIAALVAASDLTPEEKGEFQRIVDQLTSLGQDPNNPIPAEMRNARNPNSPNGRSNQSHTGQSGQPSKVTNEDGSITTTDANGKRVTTNADGSARTPTQQEEDRRRSR